jgi:type III pantothenate kinase
MNLAIDIGNTLTKTALFNNTKLESYLVSEKVMDAIHLANSQEVEQIIISSVGKEINHYLNLIENKDRIMVLDGESRLPFTLDYDNRFTLGVDRIAAVAGGLHVYPHTNLLVIDMGTCVTYDYIDDKAIYRGGAISPGMQMRFKALHQYTAKLPYITNPSSHIDVIGKSTMQCLESGVINGLLAELKFQIQAYRSQFENLQVIICGGDAVYFNTILKEDIVLCSELVMLGLNSILQYHNASNI